MTSNLCVSMFLTKAAAPQPVPKTTRCSFLECDCGSCEDGEDDDEEDDDDLGNSGSMRKDAPFSARKSGYDRGWVTRSIRSGGMVAIPGRVVVVSFFVGVLVTVAAVVVVVAVADGASLAVAVGDDDVVVADGCSVSIMIVWPLLPSLFIVSRSIVDVRRCSNGIGREDGRTEKQAVVGNTDGERYA